MNAIDLGRGLGPWPGFVIGRMTHGMTPVSYTHLTLPTTERV